MTNKPQFVGERVSFTDTFSEVSRGVKKFKQNQYVEYGAHPIVDQGQELIAGYSDDETGLFNDVPAIVFGDHTRCVKYVEEPFFAGADGVKILKPRLSDNTRFWWHELKATPIENLGYSRHFKLLKAATFKTYDTASQTEIVARLDSILDQIAQANQQIEQLNQLVKSRFVEMFGDPSECDNRWPTSRLDVFAQVITGNTPSRKRPNYYGKGTEWVKTDNIVDLAVTTAAEQLTNAGCEKARLAPKGSILMACIAGSVKSIGKVGLLDREVAFNQQINAIVPSDKVDARFLLIMLSLSKAYLCSDVNQQLKGILNKSALSAKRFPLPPLALQHEYAAFAAQVDKSRFVAQQQIEKLQMLYDSLAQEYFGD